MRFFFFTFSLFTLYAGTSLRSDADEPKRQEAQLQHEWEHTVVPIFEQHCYDCHGDGRKEGGLSLDRFSEITAMRAERPLWLNIDKHLRQHLMPPLDEAPLPERDRDILLQWIEGAIFPTDPLRPDPGHTPLRRLNRVEYVNTIRDLLHIEIDLQKHLPPDDTAYGYDTIGEALTLSPAHLEQYFDTTQLALNEAIRTEPMPFPSQPVAFTNQEGAVGITKEGEYVFTKNSKMSVSLALVPGEYELVVYAAGTKGDGEFPQMQLTLQGVAQALFEVKNARSHAELRAYRHRLTARAEEPLDLSIAFVNDFYDPHLSATRGRDRNLYVQQVTLVGPLGGPRLPLPASHQILVSSQQPGEEASQYYQRLITPFLTRAFRRPVLPAERDRYLALALQHHAKKGFTQAQTLQAVYRTALLSPSFLYHYKGLQDPSGRLAPLDDYALASRLSYFLWSTMPDPPLWEAARQGTLRRDLSIHLNRLLSDARSSQFIKHFFGQWLQLRSLKHHTHSRQAFPTLTRQIKDDMHRETELLITHILQENLPITTLIEADYTFLNERLARYYGLSEVKGDTFRKVILPSTTRRGLLGHGSFHLLTSHPDRTSPVLRGKYVLENLLDINPPPPPQNVDQLQTESAVPGRTLRQELEAHRQDPSCASCHQLMDPIGFALEEFDAAGKQRTHYDNGALIDTTSILPSGLTIDAADGLRALLIDQHQNAYARSISKNLLIYAIGRGYNWYDKPTIDSIVSHAARQKNTLRAFIEGVVSSTAFQNERGERFEP